MIDKFYNLKYILVKILTLREETFVVVEKMIVKQIRYLCKKKKRITKYWFGPFADTAVIS